MTTVDIDLLGEQWLDRVPFEQFDHLRRHDPVHWHLAPDGPGFWAVTRHADVQAVSRDAATYSSELGGTMIEDLPEEALAQMRLSIINMDPPRHARYRKIVAKAFTPGVIAQLTAEIDRRAVAAVDDVCERGACDLVDDIAARVPIQTICSMIGLDDDEWPEMLRLSKALVSGTDEAATAAMDLFARCGEVASARRATPRHDLTTALVHAEVDGERLDDLEVCLFFLTLVVAGNESTRYLIANSAVTLLEHHEARDLLRADPDRWDGAVEELLRWCASVRAFRRTATRATELGCTAIGAGDKVVMFYLSANRDEARFPDPYRFDITRSPNDHLTFGGGGIHACLGSNLARAQIRSTLREVVERLPDLAPDGPPTRLRSTLFNGYSSLPVTFRCDDS
jgi:cholest-4-en-3-one 26-monooxygenase